MRVIACDDDKTTLELIERWTREWMENRSYQYIAYENGIELLKAMEDYWGDEPQIVLIDIKLKNDNGIDVAKMLNKKYGNVAIIFISGYTEYFEDSFEADPVYFLVKPMKKENFEKAMERAMKKLMDNERKFLLVKGKELRRVFYEEIYYCESAARKVKLHGTFGEIEFYEKLDNLEEELQGEFVRCHKSFLVNMRHVRCVDAKEITLLEGTKVPVSRKKAQATKEMIFDYLGRMM